MQTWSGSGDATDGEFIPAADVDFHIDVDPSSSEEMVTVTEAKPARRQGASSCAHAHMQKQLDTVLFHTWSIGHQADRADVTICSMHLLPNMTF